MNAPLTLSRLAYPIFGLLALVELLVMVPAAKDTVQLFSLLPLLIILQMLLIVAARQTAQLVGRYEALHQAYENELRFSRQNDQLSPALSMIDTDGRISYVNPACEAMLGYSAREMIGRLRSDFAEGHEIQFTVDDLSRPKTWTTNLRRADGDVLRVLVTDRPYWHHGRLAGNLATMVPLDMAAPKTAALPCQLN